MKYYKEDEDHPESSFTDTASKGKELIYKSRENYEHGDKLIHKYGKLWPNAKLCKNAVSKSEIHSLFHYAHLFWKGEYVPRHHERVFYYSQEAAKLLHAGSLYSCPQMLENGEGFQKDILGDIDSMCCYENCLKMEK